MGVVFCRKCVRSVAMCTAVAAVVSVVSGSSQEMFSRGQNVAPVFEGWEQNSDGAFTMVFGYMNRNWDEHLQIPIGPENAIEPGGPDLGQPTRFLPRRNQSVFRVEVPKDFGAKELVWTLTAYDKTERVYATLKQEYTLEDYGMNVGEFDEAPRAGNKAPIVDVEPNLTARVGKPLPLTALVSDDGIPEAKPAPSRIEPGFSGAMGLRVAWYPYRTAGRVTFDPPQFKVYQDFRSDSPWTPGWVPPPVPPDGTFSVTANFAAAGTYVLRVMAHDGRLKTDRAITVMVTP